MAVPKRAVVLRLAELEKYPTLRARYEITLPFHSTKAAFQDYVRCHCEEYDADGGYNYACNGSCDDSISFAKHKAEAIKQTEKRWAWFSEARRLDDLLGRRLGTLGYLPLEIREMVWGAVIDNYKEVVLRKKYGSWDNPGRTPFYSPLEFGRRYSDDPRQLDAREIFDLHSYHDQAPFKGGAMYLRFVSPQAKIELENTFISVIDFTFTTSRLLDRFLSQLSACHRPLLRSITLKLSVNRHRYIPHRGNTQSAYRAWIAAIERLPATLRSVTFQLGSPRFWPKNRVSGIEEFTVVLEFLAKNIQRRAPGVKMSVAGLDKLCHEDQEMLQNMLDGLVPHSEDFTEWSEQTLKAAMD